MILELFENINQPYETLTEDGCILYPEQCYYLCKISISSLIASLYALYKEYYELALIPFGVFLTSINYWIHPDYGWRRKLDIIYVSCSLTYQVTRAYRAENAYYYYALLGIGISSFPLGVLYRNNVRASTFLHSLVHIFGNISNIVLYSGSIPKLWNM